MNKFLVVDQLHEFELGVWKSIFKHIVRILEAARSDLVHELNQQYVPRVTGELDDYKVLLGSVRCQLLRG